MRRAGACCGAPDLVTAVRGAARRRPRLGWGLAHRPPSLGDHPPELPVFRCNGFDADRSRSSLPPATACILAEGPVIATSPARDDHPSQQQANPAQPAACTEPSGEPRFRHDGNTREARPSFSLRGVSDGSSAFGQWACRAMSRGEERRSTPPSGRRPFRAGACRAVSTSTVTVRGIWQGTAVSIGRSSFIKASSLCGGGAARRDQGRAGRCRDR